MEVVLEESNSLILETNLYYMDLYSRIIITVFLLLAIASMIKYLFTL